MSLGCELSLRLLYYEQLKIQQPPLIYVLSDQFGWLYQPDIEAEIIVPSVAKRFRTNSAGFHGPVFSETKSPGKYRVAVVGASGATGIWLSTSRGFVQMLQDEFDESGAAIEMMNFSIDGARRMLERLRLIESVVLSYEPDLILNYLGPLPIRDAVVYRDMYRGYVYSVGHSRMPLAELASIRRQHQRLIDEIIDDMPLARVYDASYVARAIFRVWDSNSRTELTEKMSMYQRKRIYPSYRIPLRTLEESLDRMEATVHKVSNANSRMVFYQYSDSAPADTRLDREPFEIVNLELPNDRSLFHEFDSHFSEAGHRFVADRMRIAILELRAATEADASAR